MRQVPQIATPKPVFLICSERSGSNLITTIMGCHSQIYAHPPYHLGRGFLLNLHLAGKGGTTSLAWQKLCAQTVEKASKYLGDAEADRWRTWFDSQTLIEPRDIARFLFLEQSPNPDTKLVFVKENNLHHLIFFLIDCFPDAKFIFQVRDPRDFLASAKKRKKIWLGNKFGSVRNALNIWREDQLGGLRALALLGASRVHLLRYEDLVSHGVDTLKRLCSFCEVEFEPEMLNFHMGDQAKQLAVKAGPRENLAKPLIASNFNKYRKVLSKADIRSVEAYVGDLMDIFGYVRDLKKRAVPRFFTILRPVFLEPIERIINVEVQAQYKVGSSRSRKELDEAIEPLLPPLEQLQTGKHI